MGSKRVPGPTRHTPHGDALPARTPGTLGRHDEGDVDESAKVSAGDGALFGSPSSAKGVASTASVTLRVYVVEVGSNKLTEEMRAAARKKILDELNPIAAKSKRRDIKRGFKLIWPSKDPRGTKLGPGELVIYLLHKTDAKLMEEVTKSVRASNEQEILEHQQKQLASEGGFALEGTPYGAVGLEKSEFFIDNKGAYPSDDQRRLPGRVGRMLGETVVHEVAHLLGADHDEGSASIMSKRQTMGMDAPPRSLSETSRNSILKTLDDL